MAARGAAWRRRRLRSMLRHERQRVAAALHHRCGGRLGTNDGLRAQKTASAGPAECFESSSKDGRPAGGERPPSQGEPRGSARVVHTTCPCSTVPSLVLAELGGGREEVDSSAVVFLVSRAVEDRKKEVENAKEEEARVERIENLILVGAPVSAADKAAWRRWASGAKRKKKKRRKKKLPNASSSRSSSIRNRVREEYPDRIMEGLSTPVGTLLGITQQNAHLAGVWRGSGGAVYRRDQGAVFGQGF